jgi:hypothetical protein
VCMPLLLLILFFLHAHGASFPFLFDTYKSVI